MNATAPVEDTDVVSFEQGTEVAAESLGYELRNDPNAQVGVDEKRFVSTHPSIWTSCIGLVLIGLAIPVTSWRVATSLGTAGTVLGLVSALLWLKRDMRPRRAAAALPHEIRALTRPVPVSPAWVFSVPPPAPHHGRSSYARLVARDVTEAERRSQQETARPERAALEVQVGDTLVRCQVGDDVEYVAALVRALQSRE